MPTELHVADHRLRRGGRVRGRAVAHHQPRSPPCAAGRHGRRARRRVPRVGASRGAAASATAADHLPGRARRARGDQGLGAGHRLGAGAAATCGRSRSRTRCSATFNPFAEELAGDWVVLPAPRPPPRKHLGDVYLDGPSFYEVATPRRGSPTRRGAPRSSTTGRARRSRSVDPDQTQLRLVRGGRRRRDDDLGELPGRRPERASSSRSTSGARSSTRPSTTSTTSPSAASSCARRRRPWTPPTADQPGLIGPNWAKGWIIEDNVIHDAKCSAISIGKEASTGDNYATSRGDKPGYQYQLESVFSARQIGWDHEHVGSHVIRRNTHLRLRAERHRRAPRLRVLDDRGQPHLTTSPSSASSTGTRSRGIKLHAAHRRARSAHNRIHDCSLGIWLDWQTQGTRVARNVLYGNSRDLFVEVSPRPLRGRPQRARPRRSSFESFSQGGAYRRTTSCAARSGSSR